MTPEEKREFFEMKAELTKLKHQIEDLTKAVGEMKPQRDISESPRPQRSASSFRNEMDPSFVPPSGSMNPRATVRR